MRDDGQTRGVGTATLVAPGWTLDTSSAIAAAMGRARGAGHPDRQSHCSLISGLATTGHWRASLGLYLTFVALALLWVATGAWLFTSSIEHGPRFAGERLTGPGNAPALPLQ